MLRKGRLFTMDEFNFINEESRNFAKEVFDKVVDTGLDFKLRDNMFEERKVQFINDFDLHAPQQGESIQAILDYFNKNVLPYSANFATSKFMGFPDAGNSIAGTAGAIFSEFMQQNLINSSFFATVATYMEIQAISWLRESSGYKIPDEVNSVSDIGGVMTYGGTGSNVTALLLARENHLKNTMHTGVQDPTKFKVVVPQGIGHYSVASSMRWLGLGDNIIEVPTHNFRYDLDALKRALQENYGNIMAVVAYAGDSRTQTIERLDSVADIVKDADPSIWLHADAANGFVLSFSEKLKYKIKGIEKFDSIATDPHKVLMVPYSLSVLLLKNPENIDLIRNESDLILQDDFSLGKSTPFIGSKSWASLRLWFVLKQMGVKKVAEIIDDRYQLAQHLKNRLIEKGKFKILNDVDFSSVAFLYIPNGVTDIEKINDVNVKMYEQMMVDGKYYLHQFPIQDDKQIFKNNNHKLYPLRYMAGNPNITVNDIDEMVNYVEDLGDSLNDAN